MDIIRIEEKFQEIKERYPYETSVHSHLSKVGGDVQWLIEEMDELKNLFNKVVNLALVKKENKKREE